MNQFTPSLKLQIMGTLMKLVESEAGLDDVAAEILSAIESRERRALRWGHINLPLHVLTLKEMEENYQNYRASLEYLQESGS